MAGRPPKATKLKLLSGNPGKRALPDERVVASGPAAKPEWLADGKSKIKRRASLVWDELAPLRVEMGLLNNCTQEFFAALCVYVAAFRIAPLALKPHHLTDMRAKSNAFGFDPSSLTKLGLTTDQPSSNPFAELA
jgi:hypothetical protein